MSGPLAVGSTPTPRRTTEEGQQGRATLRRKLGSRRRTQVSIQNLRRMTLAAMALLVCLFFVWAFWSWFSPPWTMRLATGLLAVGVFALWPLYFARALPPAPDGDTFAAAGQDESQQVAALLRELGSLGFTEGAEQLEMLGEKYRNLADVLGRRLDAGEVTYGRYLGMAERVYLAAVENLQDVAIGLRSISTIDPAALALRLEDLRQRTDFPVPEAIRAVEERRTLYQSQRQRIGTLLSQTEAAMTALDHTCAALAGVRSARGLTDASIEEAMKDLAELADRTGRYAARTT